MQQKGQGSLEYLLIIGGGILVAVVIIGAIVSLAGSSGGGTQISVANAACNTYTIQESCIAANIDGVQVPTVEVCPTGWNGDLTPGEGECCWNTSSSIPLNTRCVLATNAVVDSTD